MLLQSTVHDVKSISLQDSIVYGTAHVGMQDAAWDQGDPSTWINLNRMSILAIIAIAGEMPVVKAHERGENSGASMFWSFTLLRALNLSNLTFNVENDMMKRFHELSHYAWHTKGAFTDCSTLSYALFFFEPKFQGQIALFPYGAHLRREIFSLIAFEGEQEPRWRHWGVESRRAILYKPLERDQSSDDSDQAESTQRLQAFGFMSPHALFWATLPPFFNESIELHQLPSFQVTLEAVEGACALPARSSDLKLRRLWRSRNRGHIISCPHWRPFYSFNHIINP